MKFKVWTEAGNDEKPPVLLRLVQEYGSVFVKIVDEHGLPRASIGHFRANGHFYRTGSIDPALGLDLDGQGRIKLDEE